MTLEEELAWHDRQLKVEVTQDACGQQFSRGRDASAALGLVPKQHSSGDKQVLLGISKLGNAYVHAQVVHGARSVVSRITTSKIH